jgi:hypothetical protein
MKDSRWFNGSTVHLRRSIVLKIVASAGDATKLFYRTAPQR